MKKREPVTIETLRCSTFKIFLALVGYHEKILIHETHPEWEFKEGYVDFLDIWKQPQTPITWMKNSCVWYSQVLIERLGLEKFKAYIEKFNYGSQDISGDQGKNNGLTQSWLSSSLQISPEEQIEFLQNLVDNKLPVSFEAHAFTKKILFVEDLPKGWKLYGKTGTGRKKIGEQELKIGWFIGWIEKDERVITFVHYIEDDHKIEASGGKQAKEMAKEKNKYIY